MFYFLCYIDKCIVVKFGKFSAIIFSNVFLSFCLSSVFITLSMNIWVCLMFSEELSFCFFVFYLWFSDCIISINLSLSLLILSSISSKLFLRSLSEFSVQLLYFSAPEFPFVLLFKNLYFYDILHLIFLLYLP